jgi:hypothetical protein
VEGDDRHVAWADLPAFFSQFETQGATGGDGFLLIAPTSKNRHLLSNIASDGHQKSAEEISLFLSNTDAQ